MASEKNGPEGLNVSLLQVQWREREKPFTVGRTLYLKAVALSREILLMEHAFGCDMVTPL